MNADEPSDPRHASPGKRLPAAEWVVASGAVDDVLAAMQQRLRFRRRRLSTLAGAAVAMLAAGAFWRYASEPADRPMAAPASSAVVSLPARETLPDGSIVELRHDARISTFFDERIRRVILTEGEAHFQVAKQTRPFVVAVGNVEVRAVGTAFSVNLARAEVEVLVTEGTVAVEKSPSSAGGPFDIAQGRPFDVAQGGSESAARVSLHAPGLNPSSSGVIVSAGNRLVVPSGIDAAPTPPAVVAVEEAELAMRLAWRTPRLEFSRTALAEAVAMMNEHAGVGRSMTVTLANPSLGRVHVSGMLRADNWETLFRLLEDEHGIVADRRTSREVVLRQR